MKMGKHKKKHETSPLGRIRIEKLKLILGITEDSEANKIFAKIFGLNTESYRNSSAKKRYETALCNFYELLKYKNLIK
jgi:hypothetical protein